MLPEVARGTLLGRCDLLFRRRSKQTEGRIHHLLDIAISSPHDLPFELVSRINLCSFVRDRNTLTPTAVCDVPSRRAISACVQLCTYFRIRISAARALSSATA